MNDKVIMKYDVNLDWVLAVQTLLIVMKLFNLTNINWWWVWSPTIGTVLAISLLYIILDIIYYVNKRKS